jgi:hypothetical protein
MSDILAHYRPYTQNVWKLQKCVVAISQVLCASDRCHNQVKTVRISTKRMQFPDLVNDTRKILNTFYTNR